MDKAHVTLIGKESSLVDAITSRSDLKVIMPDGTKFVSSMDQAPGKFDKIWAVGAFRYRYAYWNTRAYCAPHPLYSEDEVKNLVNFVLKIGTLESLWWVEDEKKTGLYSNYGLLVNLAEGAFDSIFLYENGRFRETQFHYVKE